MNETDVELNTEDQSFNKIKTLAKEAYKLIDQRKYKDAKDKFLELLVTDPNNTYGLVGMGDLLYKTQSYEEAIKYYKTCLSLDTSNKFSIMGLMNCYRDMKQLNQVIHIAEEYRHITMSDASILSRVADAHRKLKNFKESEIYYKKNISSIKTLIIK
jgi:tetratricopeptide (TPR) repeat protein